MGLVELPPELLIHVLAQLGLADLAACQQVCKHLHRTITTSTQLQYLTSLLLHGLSDDPHSLLPTSERLTRLQSHAQRWRTLIPSSSHTLTLPTNTGSTYELYGSLFVRGLSDNPDQRRTDALHILQLPSAVNGSRPARDWIWRSGTSTSTSSTRHGWADFTLSPSDDLIVLVEQRPEAQTSPSFRLHLLTITSGLPHPAAREAVLEHTCPDSRPGRERQTRYAYLMQVCGGALGVLFLPRERTPEYVRGEVREELVVWDWRTGAVRAIYGGSLPGNSGPGASTSTSARTSASASTGTSTSMSVALGVGGGQEAEAEARARAQEEEEERERRNEAFEPPKTFNFLSEDLILTAGTKTGALEIFSIPPASSTTQASTSPPTAPPSASASAPTPPGPAEPPQKRLKKHARFLLPQLRESAASILSITTRSDPSPVPGPFGLSKIPARAHTSAPPPPVRTPSTSISGSRSGSGSGSGFASHPSSGPQPQAGAAAGGAGRRHALSSAEQAEGEDGEDDPRRTEEQDQELFHPSPAHARLLTVALMLDAPPETSDELTVFVLLPTLLSAVQDPDRWTAFLPASTTSTSTSTTSQPIPGSRASHLPSVSPEGILNIPWNQWNNEARIIDSLHSPPGYVCYVHGWRYVTGVPFLPPGVGWGAAQPGGQAGAGAPAGAAGAEGAGGGGQGGGQGAAGGGGQGGQAGQGQMDIEITLDQLWMRISVLDFNPAMVRRVAWEKEKERGIQPGRASAAEEAATARSGAASGAGAAQGATVGSAQSEPQQEQPQQQREGVEEQAMELADLIELDATSQHHGPHGLDGDIHGDLGWEGEVVEVDMLDDAADWGSEEGEGEEDGEEESVSDEDDGGGLDAIHWAGQADDADQAQIMHVTEEEEDGIPPPPPTTSIFIDPSPDPSTTTTPHGRRATRAPADEHVILRPSFLRPQDTFVERVSSGLPFVLRHYEVPGLYGGLFLDGERVVGLIERVGREVVRVDVF